MRNDLRCGLSLAFVLTACAGPDLSVCGNGAMEAGEACDDGNAITEPCEPGQNKCSVCTSTCQLADGVVTFCGDGRVNGDETCDDGNAFAELCTYGQTSCTVCGAACRPVVGETSFCGDGRQAPDDGEECDDGNTVIESCPDEQPCTVCGSACTQVVGARPRCGDGTVQASRAETCDDANLAVESCAYGETSCMVCGPACTEVPGVPNTCGDSVVDAAESCDDGNAATETCAYGTTCMVCNASCQRQAVMGPACGDGQTDGAAGETCDDGNVVNERCAYGAMACQVCDSTCHQVAGAISSCGDSLVDLANGEACDDGNTLTEACAYDATSCAVCNSTCTAVVAGAVSRCGDGLIQVEAGEACDDGNVVTERCAYGARSCTVCSSRCASTSGAISRCGDGVVDTTNAEQCDDGNTVDNDGCEANCRFECGGSVGQTRAYLTSLGCHLFYASPSSWYDAQTTCASAGFNLATIRTATDNAFLQTIGGGTVYLGFNDIAADGHFVWQSGQSVLYTNWETNEPNGSTGENCAEMYSSGRWNDGQCTTTRSFICGNATCGNGVVESNETCDDGNTTEGDACPSSCSLCGNGTVNTGEQCDDANSNNNDSCTSFCKTAVCGDGYVQSGEQCDDGNTVSGDGCESACQLLCGKTDAGISISTSFQHNGSCYARLSSLTASDLGQTRCEAVGGNLVTLEDEAEDTYLRSLRGSGSYNLGLNDKADAGTYVWRSGLSSTLDQRSYTSASSSRCFISGSSTMAWVPTLCTAFSQVTFCEFDLPTCGDGTVNPGTEQCDDGNKVTESCTYGQTSCPVCTRTCQLEARARFCGDGKVTDTEQCDDGNSVAGDGCTACTVTSGFSCHGAPSVCLANSQVLVQGPGLDAGIPNDAYAVASESTTMRCFDFALGANPDGGSNLVKGVFVTLGMASENPSDLIIKVKAPVGDVVTLMSLPGRFESLADINEFDGNVYGQLVSTHPVTFADGASRPAELMAVSISPTQAACRDDGYCAFDPNAGVHAAGKLSLFKGRSALGTWQVCLGDMSQPFANTVDQVQLGVLR